MDLTLPSPYSRMGLPPLRNRNKERAEEINRNLLDSFIAENCFPVVGDTIDFAIFYKRFLEWLPEEERFVWRKGLVIDEVKQRFAYGTAGAKHARLIGNLSFSPTEPRPGAIPWITKGNALVHENQETPTPNNEDTNE